MKRDRTGGQAPLGAFGTDADPTADLLLGGRARDDEQADYENVVHVVGFPGETAAECVVAGQTVAAHNPDYPADDPVVRVVFADDAPGTGELRRRADLLLDAEGNGVTDRGEAFARVAAAAADRTYSYPASRLSGVDEEEPHDTPVPLP